MVAEEDRCLACKQPESLTAHALKCWSKVIKGVWSLIVWSTLQRLYISFKSFKLFADHWLRLWQSHGWSRFELARNLTESAGNMLGPLLIAYSLLGGICEHVNINFAWLKYIIYKSFVAQVLRDFCVFTLNGHEFLLSSGQTTQTTMQFDLLNLTCGSNPKERSKKCTKCTKCTLPEFLLFCLIPPEVEGSFSPTSGRRLEKPGAIARSCATAEHWQSIQASHGFTIHRRLRPWAGLARRYLSHVSAVCQYGVHQRVLRTLEDQT